MQKKRDALEKTIFQAISGLVTPSKMAFREKHSLLMWFFLFWMLVFDLVLTLKRYTTFQQT